MDEGTSTHGRPATRRRWRWRWALGLLAAAGLTAYSPWLWASAQSRDRVHEVADAPAADVTLVLGAGLTPDDTPSPYLAARLDVAAALLQAGKTKVLLLSGDNRYHDYDEPTAMQTYLVERGVPPERIVLDFAGRDTYDSCSRAKRIFGVDRMLVVSQGYHLPRAVATCQDLGIAPPVPLEEDAVVAGSRHREVRERTAALKMVWDLVSRRDPVLGPPESGVRDALARLA